MPHVSLTSNLVGHSFWECETPPKLIQDSPALVERVNQLHASYLPEAMKSAFSAPAEISAMQLVRAQHIVACALTHTRVYEHHIPNNILTEDLNWDRFRSIRPISKKELRSQFPHGVLNASLDPSSLYPTRSSGSSGETLDIRIDNEALALDAIQGVRQVALQSGLKLGEKCHVAHIYTVPWPATNAGPHFVNHFISSVMPPNEIVKKLLILKADVIAGYPSVLLEVAKLFRSDGYAPKLVITHSEQSTLEERRYLTRKLGADTRDEYSSEEAARIALELPCGSYHSCDDSVIVEILDPVSFQPAKQGDLGVVVVTNLLNTAMPFVRYIQGDLAIAGARCSCAIGWGVIQSIEGREGDSFINKHGKIVPSGTLLDVCYRAMSDNETSFPRFELIQVGTDEVLFRFDTDFSGMLPKVERSLCALLMSAMGHTVRLTHERVAQWPAETGRSKRRSIRRSALFQQKIEQDF